MYPGVLVGSRTEAQLAAAARWRDNNRERTREYARRWRLANPDYIKNWRRKNPGYDKDWYSANHLKAVSYRQAYRARVRSARIGEVTASKIAEKMAYWGEKCWMCGGPFEHVDHVKPLAKGGAHIIANLRPACASCNCRKNDKWDGSVAS